jgi:hypothetical protein
MISVQLSPCSRLEMSSPIELVECDGCECIDDLRNWESASGHMYMFCESCWLDVRDTSDTLEEQSLCEECRHEPVTQTFFRLDGVTLDLCDACFALVDHEPISSQICEKCDESRAAHPIREADGRRVYVCVPCFETLQQRKAPTHTICEDCDRKFASIVVSRDERTTVDLCEDCYEASRTKNRPEVVRDAGPGDKCSFCMDGTDATLVWECRPPPEGDGHLYPLCADCWADLTRPRSPPRPAFCECPLPCNDAVTTHCDLCHGYVPKLSDDWTV